MKKRFWTTDDFDVFSIEGLENRMNALQDIIQPKFQKLGRHFADRLSAYGTDEFFPHVAKHARRTVNPPKDSWVAFAPAKRGYKALPHFQIGLWGTHLFIILAVIYENPDKKGIAERLDKNNKTLLSLPTTYIVSGDHMKPDATHISTIGLDGLEKLLDRLKTVKKAEFLVGRHLLREDAVQMSNDEFIAYAEETFDELLKIYDIVIGRY
ncbi:YktB family protein [Sporosarcina sp. FA9]|uniref:YktB family protein n=1 Tax=Sporosarcina sp. FA9 TaxID=3413030 RepID=UPI003F660B00